MIPSPSPTVKIQIDHVLITSMPSVKESVQDRFMVEQIVFQFPNFNVSQLLPCQKLLNNTLIALLSQENGTEATGEPDWKGCANVRLRTLESATWFHHYVAAFNINTNQWCMNYVFKRLKFLNNRMVRNYPVNWNFDLCR